MIWSALLHSLHSFLWAETRCSQPSCWGIMSHRVQLGTQEAWRPRCAETFVEELCEEPEAQCWGVSQTWALFFNTTVCQHNTFFPPKKTKQVASVQTCARDLIEHQGRNRFPGDPLNAAWAPPTSTPPHPHPHPSTALIAQRSSSGRRRTFCLLKRQTGRVHRVIKTQQSPRSLGTRTSGLLCSPRLIHHKPPSLVFSGSRPDGGLLITQSWLHF